jgi:hypothetical protein
MDNSQFSINNCLLNFVPEQLRSVEEILGEIDALNDDLKALEEELAL